ncbi:MAG TPA: hypothetical protein VGM88_35285 [Kofleriaceae bacterium]
MSSLASLAPNPFPTFSFLAAGQLVRTMTIEGNSTYGPPPGLSVAAGQLMVGQQVRINHVSIDELAANASAPGTDLEATLWLVVSMSTNSIALSAVRIDEGTQQHALSPPKSLGTQVIPLPDFAGEIDVTAAALVRAPGSLVVARLAVDTLSATIITSAPIVDQRPDGDVWTIFLASDVLIDVVIANLNDQLAASLPAGTTVEVAPSGEWQHDSAGWGMCVSLGLLSVDACPALLGNDPDMSVEADIRVDFTPDVDAGVIHSKLHATHHVDPGDSARCFAQNFGAIALISFLGGPLVAALNVGVEIAALLVGPLIFGAIVDEMAGDQVANQNLDGFTKQQTPDGADDATFTRDMKLPMLLTSTPNHCEVTAAGISIGGPVPFVFPGKHVMGLAPAPVTGDWDASFSCQTESWSRSYSADPIHVTDAVQVLGTTVVKPAVVMFSTTTARPEAAWSTKIASGKVGTVTVDALGDPTPGTTGMVFVHSSAGLARVDLVAVAQPPAPPDAFQLIALKVGCMKTGSAWPGGGFDPHWTVDPGPEGELRQWILEVAQLAIGSSVTASTVGAGIAQSGTLVGKGTAAAFDFITAREQTLHVAVGGTAPVTGILSQRSLVPTRTVDLGGAILALTRVGNGTIAALTGKTVAILEPMTGDIVARHASRGATHLEADARGLVAWGPGGAYRLTGAAAGTITLNAVSAAQRTATRALVLHGADGQLTLSGLAIARATEVQIRPSVTAPVTVQSIALRESSLAIAMGTKLVFARAGQLFRDVAVSPDRPRIEATGLAKLAVG